MLIACATDNGKTFIDRHFGDALQYDIYKWDSAYFKYVKTIINTSEEDDEEIHGDPKKAKQILDLLLEEDVKVGVSMIFGPNIKKIRKRLVPIIVSEKTIEEGLKVIANHIEEVNHAIGLKEKNTHIDLRKRGE